MDVSDLDLTTVMLHHVPQAGRSAKGEAALQLADVAVVLTAELRAFLVEKVRTALRNRARPVTEDVAAGSAVAAAIRAHLEGAPASRDLVATSKTLAQALHAAQPGNSPSGMVLVADVVIAGGHALLLAKLDIETGVAASTTVASGQTVVSIEIVPGLFVTDQTRVFKIALFAASGVLDGALHGQVVDAQMDGAGIANFFLQLLGCSLSQRSQELTEQFFDTTQNWLNSGAVSDPEVRAKLEIALITEMGNEARQINPMIFAATHVPTSLRDNFADALTAGGVSATSFKKELDLIQSRIKRVQIETISGVLVLAPPDKLSDGTVAVSNEGSGSVKINDGIKRVSGRGGR